MRISNLDAFLVTSSCSQIRRTRQPSDRNVCGDKLVPRLVHCEFSLPEGRVVLGLRGMLWTAMPETAVHKYRQLQFWKYEIWLAEYRLMSTPAGDSISP